MTEENHNSEPAPSNDEWPQEDFDETREGTDPTPDSPEVPPVSADSQATPTPFDPPHTPEATPPAPPAAPAPWPPADQPSLSPEEDEALREQRARRFGGQEGENPPDVDAAAEPATQVFSPGHPEAEPASPDRPAPVVTPIPAAPAGSTFADPASQGADTGQYAPAAQSHVPPTTQQQTVPPHSPATPHHHDDFDGLDEGPASRAAAHWWTVLITLVFAPVGWYLFTDGGARIQWAGSQGQLGSVGSYIEFGLGLLAVFIFLLAARWSSVGAIIMGAIFFALGVAFLAVPDEGARILMQSTEYFGRLGQFGINVVEHLATTLETGRMALYGLVMIMVGIVSHGARRQGRREERTKIALGE